MKINFKGACNIKVPFEYVCLTCREHEVIEHTRKEDMANRKCSACGNLMARHIDGAPSLDADYHESQLTHNLGWD
jgi:DNA-directed RNA polymerase subunit RPC12/RpoP